MPATEPTLTDIALGALARRLAATHPAADELVAWRHGAEAAPAPSDLDRALRRPAEPDERMARVATDLQLTRGEVLSVALAAAVERDLLVGRGLSLLQAPVGGSRPTLGLLADLFRSFDQACSVAGLAGGAAVASGLLALGEASAPLPERPAAVPIHLLHALGGRDAWHPGAAIGLGAAPPIRLPPSIEAQAARYAASLMGEPDRVLMVRSGAEAEGRAVADAIARALGRRPLFIEHDEVAGLTPWLLLADLVPVFTRQPAPGERARLPELPRYSGPTLVVCGPDGSVERSGRAALSWTVPVPPAAERVALWADALEDKALARRMAHQRYPSARIAELARLARHRAAAAGQARPSHEDVVAVAREGDTGSLDALAQPLREPIPNEALVLPDALHRDLETLRLRCLHRESLATGLGVGASTRYGAGVRALLVGPSGTGKTLAAGWLATRLDLPLFRVDLASILSKYIGETEKNLAQLLARAEHSEVVLLFDEADSLFGKRTEVKQANDRFANAQTNYLLQRIESYEGIALLTSNSRSRFDPAFTRRLDMIIEFPLPSAQERLQIWRGHLGEGWHRLEHCHFNQLATVSDLAGGHVRNVVLAAAVYAREAGRCIEWNDVLRGLAVEYRKLGRQSPQGLREEVDR